MPPSVFAAIGVPTAGQCLQVLGPIAGLFFLWWVIRNTDNVIRKLFPSLEWQTQLGWLNYRAERRANAFWRWITYGIYATLALALGGFVWSAARFAQLSDSADLAATLSILPVLLLSIGFWVIYFAWGLFPRLRREYEHEELERFRAETRPPGETRPRIPAQPPLISRPRFPVRR